ncbi:hypothetical protein OAO87_00665 [bacterium]|nr:hypothetical protein [bacterium]
MPATANARSHRVPARRYSTQTAISSRRLLPTHCNHQQPDECGARSRTKCTSKRHSGTCGDQVRWRTRRVSEDRPHLHGLAGSEAMSALPTPTGDECAVETGRALRPADADGVSEQPASVFPAGAGTCTAPD